MTQSTKRNVKAINALADYVERCPKTFDMSDEAVYPCCGTAGCLAAHAAMKWPSLRLVVGYANRGYTWDNKKLKARLGLTQRQAHQMFIEPRSSNDNHIDLSAVTKPMAVAMLRRFAKTGRIYFSFRDDVKVAA